MNVKNTFAAPSLIIIIMGLLLTSRLIDPDLIGMRENPYLSLIVLQFIIFTLPALFFVRLRGLKNGHGTSTLRLNFFTAEHILFMIYAVILLISGSIVLRFLTSLAVPDPRFNVMASEYAYIYDGGVGGKLYALLTFGIIPAVTEEFLFRSVIMSEYGRNGVLCTIVMNALMFSMIHLDLVLLPTYFFCGVILSFTAIVTDSVPAAVAVHIVNNITGLLCEEFFQKLTDHTKNMVLIMFVVVAIFLISLALSFGEAQRIYYNRGIMNVPTPKGAAAFHRKNTASVKSHPFLEALFSPAFIILIVFFIIITLGLD